ncbi:MAG: UvrD-helicase domain-containing protein, partial [Candidatus Nanoarchaeia archaeon]
MEKGLKTEFDIFGQDISPGSAFLIEASAGTGKTFNIQHLYLRLLLERGLEVGQILAVTFTEAATAELKNRIRNNLEKAFNMLDKLETEPKQCEEQDIILYNIILNSVKFARQNQLPVSPSENNIYAYLRRILRRSLICFDEAAIFTIHGFCSRMLNENAFESRVAYDLELVENQDDIIKELINDFWRKNFYGKNEKITKLLIEKNIYPENLMEFAELVISKPDMTLEHNLPDEILTKELSDELFLILFNNRLDALIASVSYEKKGKISKAIEILTQPHNEKDKMAVETIFEQLNSLKKNKNVKSLNKTFDSYLEECIELPLTLV